ncbi:MAG: AbrB/MazE/SpoVT family DNA-binding domain-containing protein [Armatimonadetes bacterium]|nr:AbrB/MazE/SpoVT family DNA-binding domain-containing protein [Armatimonadota bacterium]
MVSKEIKLGKRNQVTIPRDFIPKGAREFQCVKQEDGTLLLIPEIRIPATQEYFWTRRWQEGEREASEDIHSGRIRRHASADALLARLEQKRKK